MPSLTLIGRHKSELPTPCLLLDVDKLDRNLAKMAALFADRPCDLRPHVKTHKSPFIAHRQMRAGAVGLTCAKLEDAKGFAWAGLDHLLIAHQVVDPEKIEELAGLAGLVDVMVCVDDAANARQLSEIALRRGVVLGVLAEVNVGLDRCGAPPGAPTLKLVREMLKLKGLRFRGVMGYEGAMYPLAREALRAACAEACARLTGTADLLRSHDIPVDIVSAGGSNTYDVTGVAPGITEVQVGSYCTMDRVNTNAGIDFEEALTVLTTVVSRPSAHRVITDAGKKAVSVDAGLPEIEGAPHLRTTRFNEEHGCFQITGAGPGIRVGDRLEMVPTHGCTTIPFYNAYTLVRDGIVVGRCPILTGSAVY
jgi:D-serine deaminase-like pyridoxal phosphate-dependent protein